MCLCCAVEAASNNRLSFYSINRINSKLLGDDLLCRFVSRPAVYIGVIRVVWGWGGIYPEMLPSRVGCINIRATVKPGWSCIRHILPHFPKRFYGKIDVTCDRQVWIGVRNKCVRFYGLVRTAYPFTE